MPRVLFSLKATAASPQISSKRGRGKEAPHPKWGSSRQAASAARTKGRPSNPGGPPLQETPSTDPTCPHPKGRGKDAPIGVSAFEDKLVQDALREVLEAIYEQDFLDCSYGFRPGPSAHDAVQTLDRVVHRAR
jgi:hypothetical protein